MGLGEIDPLQLVGATGQIEVLRLAGFSFAVDTKGTVSIPEFEGKTIIDLGAGLSGLGSILPGLAKCSVIEVDPVYSWRGYFNKEKQETIEQLKLSYGETFDTLLAKRRNRGEGIFRSKNNIVPQGGWTPLPGPRKDIKDRFKALVPASEEFGEEDIISCMGAYSSRIKRVVESGYIAKEGVKRYASLEKVPKKKKADFIFVTHLFYSAQDPQRFLRYLFSFLSPKGRVVITDYVDSPWMENFIVMIENGEKGFHFLGEEKGVTSIGLGNWPVTK